MCGICGFVLTNSQKDIDREVLWQMMGVIKHRGPDSRGRFFAPGVCLGICRLSIIDLETGDQPISNEDGSIIVVCNGEIYNFQELRDELIAAGHSFKSHSDTEVIVHLYEEQGVGCLDRLRGMFSFALWDASRRLLILARDRLGIKPLFYALETSGLLFSSELKSILMSKRVGRDMDIQALKDVFTIGFVLAPKTLFKKIRRILPGHYLMYKDGVLTIHKYWDINFPTREELQSNSNIKPEYWSEMLRTKLEEVIRIHLRSDVPVGAWLSGGIDSSTIVSVMSSIVNHPIQTYSLGFDNDKFDEVRRQKNLYNFPQYNISNKQIVCEAKDFKLFPKVVWHCEDPFTTGVEIPIMLLSQLACEDVKVVLTGEGSDEALGGYPWFRVEKLLRPITKMPFSIRKIISRLPIVRKRWSRASRIIGAPAEMNIERYVKIIDSANPEFDTHLFSKDIRRDLIMDCNTEDELFLPANSDSWHPFSKLQYFEIKTRLSDYITRHLDCVSMAYSLESRVPFLDHEFVEFCAQIPPSLKIRGTLEKYILRLAMKDNLPEDILRRKKRGLSSPVDQWVRNLPDFAAELLSENNIQERGYFNPKFITNMLKKHRASEANYARQLMGVLWVQLWDDLFVRGASYSRWL